MTVMQAAKNLFGHLIRPLHASGSLTGEKAAPDPVADMPMQSTAFLNGEPIPQKYSQDGENISPPLSWSDVPAEAKELVLICEDPDAPMIQPFVHWMMFGLSPSTTSLPEHVPTEETVRAGGYRAMQSMNSAKSIGYVGPKPPAGHGPHHYHFQLFALNAPSFLAGRPDRDTLAKALDGKVIAMGELIGTYERT